MIEREKHPLLDSSLTLARELRRAERARRATIDPALAAYDAAADEEARMTAASDLMDAIGRANLAFTAAYVSAANNYTAREAELAGEGG